MKFALYLGNRGFFPERLIADARREVAAALAALGIDTLCAPESLTRYGAVETAAEGRAFAGFLAEHRGEYDGVLLVLPNFGDENGASEALCDCGVPIYLLAYPDELDKMDFQSRRDAFCGKLSIMDVFTQFNLPFTAWEPHTLHPSSPRFAEEMRQFAAVCRIVRGMKRCRIGAFGARPTAFKTIRFDEVALQKKGITVEVFDNSDLLLEVERVKSGSPELETKIRRFREYTDCGGVPADRLETIARLSAALDRMIERHELQAIGLRCWLDLEQTLKISPCVVLSELNSRGIPAACELDVGNAVAMYALTLASQEPAACLDWNNNYEEDPDRCILFHCGPVAQQLMAARGRVIDHPMFAKSLGAGCAFGCNVGRLRPMPFTFTSTATVDRKVCFYSGEGEFTTDRLPEEFFGCGGVARIPGLQPKLIRIGRGGYRHHVSVAEGSWRRAVDEALTNYLGYEKTEL